MNVLQFSLKLSKITLISSIVFSCLSPLMAMQEDDEELQKAILLSLKEEQEKPKRWNERILFLEDVSISTLKALKEECIQKLNKIDNNESKFNKWFLRSEKINTILDLPNRDLEASQLMLIDEDLLNDFYESKKDQHLPQNTNENNEEKMLRKALKQSIKENSYRQIEQLEEDLKFAEVLVLSENDSNHLPQNNDENDEELKRVIEESKLEQNNSNEEEIQRAIRENNKDNEKPQNMLEELKKWIRQSPKNKDKHSATTNRFTRLWENNNERKDK